MNLDKITTPTIISGGISVDDRGALCFNNDLNLLGVKRFYTIQNHKREQIRAWHGTLLNTKIFIPVIGSFIVAWRSMEFDSGNNLDNKCRPLDFGKVVISANNQKALILPPKYYNGNLSLTEGAVMMVFNTTSLNEAKNDDYRLDVRDENDYFMNEGYDDFSFYIKDR